jgi:uncharacterized repeat protein (TIGR02543 family)
MKTRLLGKNAKLAGGLGLLLALALILTAVPVLAVEPTPAQYYGTVTICGEPASEGTEVVAKIAGVEYDYCRTTVDANGNYGYTPLFKLPGDDLGTPQKEGGVVGELVEFFVLDQKAGESTFTILQPNEVNLVVTEEVTLTVTSDGCCTLTVTEVGDGELGMVNPGQTKEFTMGCTTEVELLAVGDDCCAFDGWQVDGSPVGGNPIQVTVNSDMTAIAYCSEPGPFTLTVNSDGCCLLTVAEVGGGQLGTVDPGATKEFYLDCGTKVGLTAQGSACCIFDYWVVDDGDPITENPITITMDDNYTATAYCSELGPYKLTVTSSGCCPITVAEVGGAPIGTVDPGATEEFTIDCGIKVELTAQDSVCCDFDQWVVDGGDPITENPITITMDDDHAATATCLALGPYTLTTLVDPVDSGNVTGGGTYDCCTNVQVEAIPTDGWVFVRWSGDLTGTENPATIHIDGDKEITAHFSLAEVTCTLTVKSEGCCPILVTLVGVGPLGTVDPGCTQEFTVECDGQVELEAEPSLCCHFDRWEVDGDPVGGNPITVTMDGSHTATAYCTQLGPYTLTTIVDPEGSGNVTGGGIHDCCTDVEVEAFPNEGWVFIRWSGDLGGTENPTSIHMDGNKIIIAEFSMQVYTLKVNSTAAGSVTDPGEGEFIRPAEAVVNLVAEPDNGYEFFRWTGDVGTVADVTDPTTTITMYGDYEITAVFSVWTLELSEGWNILSTPIALDSCCDTWGEFVALGDGLDVDPEAITYYYDGSTQLWGQVLAGYQLKPCDAIYVKMASADTAPIIPSSLPSGSSKPVYPGWNLVSLAALETMGVIEGMSSIYVVTGDLTGYSQVVSPPVDQPAWIYIRGGVDNPLMIPGKGYWVFMINGGTLAGFTFTPL